MSAPTTAIQEPVPLARRTRSATRVVAEAMFAGPDGPAPADRVDWLVTDLEDFLWHAGRRARTLYRLGLFVVLWFAPLWVFRLPLRWQGVAPRVKTLERIEESLFGLVLLLVKTSLCVVYFEHPDAERETGYDGRCLGDTP